MTTPAGVGLAATLMLAAVLGYAVSRLRQPPIIGEIAAAFVLGPVCLGALSPGLYHHLFPPAVLPLYTAVGHVGLVLFIFSLGFELRAAALTHRSVVLTATVAAFVVPAAFGALAGVLVYLSSAAPSAAGLTASALFLAAAISATALPVLSRILHDYRLSNTRVGRTAMSSAALIDLLAWVTLAAAVLLAGRSGDDWRSRLLGLALLAVLITVRLLCGRRLGRLVGGLSRQAVMLSGLAVALLAAAGTDALGLHAAVGALLAGLLFPRPTAAANAQPRRASGAADFRTFGQVLLPVFFMSVLMGVQVGPAARVLVAIALLLPLAMIGKVLPGYLVGRAHGWGRNEALALGFLLNTRGVTEFVLISVGLSFGLIAPSIYLALAAVAVVTTVITGPAVSALLGLRHRRSSSSGPTGGTATMAITSNHGSTSHPTAAATGEDPPELAAGPMASALDFKDFMRGFPSGVAVLGTRDEEGGPTGMTCSALCSLSLDPPMVLACVGRWGRMRKAVEHTGSFTVNLLEGPGFQLARQFAAGLDRPFEGVRWRPSRCYQLPVPTEHVHRTAECRLHSSITVSDHAILIGEVVWIAERNHVAEAPLLHGFSEFAVWRPGLATQDQP
ncbi:MAG: cation:proton antiporter [Labedaea sp.]